MLRTANSACSCESTPLKINLCEQVFVATIIHPEQGFYGSSKTTSAASVTGLFFGFGAASVLFWAYFRYRHLWRGQPLEIEGAVEQEMKARVQELIGDAALSQDRMVTEIGIMAERLDVTEEIVRLEAHLHHFLETMASHKSPGKRLGFLLQEMLREVNTLGTKSQFSDMQHLCVAWKEELEIVREQIQNIE